MHGRLPLPVGQKGVVLVPNSCVTAVTGCDVVAVVAPVRWASACGRTWVTAWLGAIVLADAPAPKAASVIAVPTMVMAPTDPASQLLR